MLFIFQIVINVLFLCLSRGQTTDNTVITLNEPNSRIRGHILSTYYGKEFYAFQDIPYAEPPVGEYRFAEPKPHSSWSGILNTTQNTKICPQTLGKPKSVTEDCLVLNVYRPMSNSSEALPVLFFIPGGAFISGDGTYATYNPEYLIEYGVIVVTVNYRIGALGFLTTEDDVIPGNLGLKDQFLALKWVNKNIACFGGDPQKVTIVGQSAGSTSASFHVLSQKATGLYRGVILESGVALSRGLFIDHAKNYSFQLGKLLDVNFTSNDSNELLKLLKKATVNDILSAANKVQRIDDDVGILEDVTWGAVVEDKKYVNALITEPMHLALKNGVFDKVPTLVGFNSQEVHVMIRNIDSVKKVAAELDKSPASLIHPKLNIPEKDRVIAGAKLQKLYTNNNFSMDLAATVSFSSEIAFVNSIIRKADLISKYVPVYLFQYSYRGATHRFIDIPSEDGAGHSEELDYLWLRNTNLTDSDALNSKRLLTMWTNFVKYLNPTPSGDSALDIPVWPTVESENLFYMDIDRNLTIKKDPKHYLGVRPIFDQYMKPPYNIY